MRFTHARAKTGSLADLLLTKQPAHQTARPSVKVADGMSEAEGSYTRRLNAAISQGRTIDEAEETQTRKVFKEVKKRQQVNFY